MRDDLARRVPRLATCLATAVLLALPAAVAAAPACRSASIGSADHGRLRCGRRLPLRGEHHYLQPFTAEQDYRWGTESLVDGLAWVADRVTSRLGTKRIAVGNLSKKGGGDLPLSGSHESGRDVDLPFLMADGKGRPIESFYHAFDDDGVSRTHGPGYRFDVRGNWELVAALLECPRFQVFGIAIAPGLKRLLLDHARAAGADPRLVARAEALLQQPRHAKPHDNHFHLRIACPPDDVPLGCVESTGLHR